MSGFTAQVRPLYQICRNLSNADDMQLALFLLLPGRCVEIKGDERRSSVHPSKGDSNPTPGVSVSTLLTIDVNPQNHSNIQSIDHS